MENWPTGEYRNIAVRYLGTEIKISKVWIPKLIMLIFEPIFGNLSLNRKSTLFQIHKLLFWKMNFTYKSWSLKYVYTTPHHHHHRATVPQYNKLLDKIQAWWKVGIQCGATPEHTKQYWTIPNQTVVPSRWRKTKDVYQKNKLITIAYRLLWQVPGIVEHWHSVWGHTRPYQTISNLTKLNQTK